MKALVTGAGGFLGRYLVEQLVARGDSVRGFSRQAYPALDRLGVASVRGDIRDPAAVRAAVAGVDVVYHTAAVPGVWGTWELFYSVNVRGTENVIAACQSAGVPKPSLNISPYVAIGSVAPAARRTKPPTINDNTTPRMDETTPTQPGLSRRVSIFNL